MSPRAACRLEALGFGAVCDYVAGKADWLAHDLPSEGRLAGRPSAGALARTDVPTCSLDETAAHVLARLASASHPFALVLSPAGVVLGRLRRSALAEARPDARAEEVMEPGPGTIRPDHPLDELLERLRARQLSTAIVTTPEGTLIGVVHRADVERGAARLPLR